MPENTHGEEIGSASGCKSHLDASRWAPENFRHIPYMGIKPTGMGTGFVTGMTSMTRTHTHIGTGT